MSTRVTAPLRRPAPGAPTETETETTIVKDGKQRKVIQLGPSELPDAGYRREEELKARNEQLEARLAAIETAMGLDSTGPQVRLSEFPIDNEIAQRIDMLNVVGALPEFHYYWANFVAMHGMDVTMHETQGYKVVCGSDPELPGKKDELGRRRIGDCILMRIPLDEHLKLLQFDRIKRERQQKGVLEGLQAMGDRWGRRGVRFKPNLSPYEAEHAMQVAHAQQIARQRFNDALRRGQVPGLQPGR